MKGVRWMPRLLRSEEGRSMAAISLGKMSSNRYNRGFPNGETPLSTIEICPYGRRRTRGSETSQYPEEKKAIQGVFFLVEFLSQERSHYDQEEDTCDSLSSGERNGRSPNRSYLYGRGCRTTMSFS